MRITPTIPNSSANTTSTAAAENALSKKIAGRERQKSHASHNSTN